MEKRKHKEWSQGDDDRIQKWWNDLGLSATQIGEKLGRGRSSVLGKIMRLRKKGMRFAEREGTRTKAASTKRKLLSPEKAYYDHAPERKAIQPPVSRKIHIIDADYGECRYIEGDGKEGLCCGHLTAPGSSYCQSHMELCNGPKQPTQGPKIRASSCLIARVFGA
jgi:hypothetical protein